MQDRAPAWSPDGATLAYVSRALGLVGAARRRRATASGERQLTSDDADYGEPAWHPDGDRIAVTRGVAQPLRPRGRRRRHRRGDRASPPAASGARRSGPRDGALVATYEDHAHAARAAASSTPPATRRAPLLAPRPLAVRSAPHVAPEDVTFPSRDGLEIPGFLFRPRDASPERPVPAVVYPHGGPTDAYRDDWDGHAQYFVDKGYAWLAVNFRGSTGYGREFERANHDVWGVEDTWDCLAAADYLRTLDWVDGDRLGDLRRQLRLLHGAAVGHRRPGAPLPLRGRASTATATSSRRGRRATARASRTSSG